MVGKGYWTTGITLRWGGDKWSVSLEFMDDGWCDAWSTEGELRVRYLVDTSKLSEAIDILIANAVRLGIELKGAALPPSLYVPGDGEWKEEKYHPEWREILARECGRLGWRNPYER